MSEEISIRVNFGNPMAMFPLDHVTLMPHAVLPLHIFEPRYRHMVSDALDGPGQIAMAVTMPGEGGDPYRPTLRPAVCVGQIVQHHKLPDGRYNIALQGVCRARIMQELPDDEDVPYRRAYLQPLGTAKIDEEELAGARARLADHPGVVFAHRYITRPHDAGGENHVALTDAEFAMRQRNRLFALAWTSHGHSYGIGIEINQWLGKGNTVVVNGSREYMAQAKLHYPELLVVTIEVPTELLRQRLLARGREDPSAIEQRLERHRVLQGSAPVGQVITNDGPLSRAGDLLVACLLEHAGQPQCV